MRISLNNSVVHVFGFRIAIILSVVAITLGSMPLVKAAESDCGAACQDETFRNNNDIIYYGPVAGNCSANGSTTLSGGDNVEKIWNWLIGKGMTKYGAAGIMGNIQVESGFNPFRLEVDGETYDSLVANAARNKAFGLVQWDGGRRPLVLKYIAEDKPEYQQYVSKTYGDEADSYTEAPPEINDAFLTAELDYMYKEATPGGERQLAWDKMLHASNEVDAADQWEEYFEGSSRTAGGTHATAATQIYNTFSGSTSSGGLSTSSSSSSCGAGNEVITEGGLTEEQAKKLVMGYGENKNDDSHRAIGDSYWADCSPGGKGSNCVSFSRFFVNKFSNKQAPTPMGNGDQVVSNMRAAGFRTGNTPKPFAVFSWDGGTYGHTGVVLGIHGDTIIVGHASCTRGNNGISGKGDGTEEGGGSAFIMVGKLGENAAFWGTTPSGFAYPDVDVNKIQDYVNGII